MMVIFGHALFQFLYMKVLRTFKFLHGIFHASPKLAVYPESHFLLGFSEVNVFVGVSSWCECHR